MGFIECFEKIDVAYEENFDQEIINTLYNNLEENLKNVQNSAQNNYN